MKAIRNGHVSAEGDDTIATEGWVASWKGVEMAMGHTMASTKRSMSCLVL
jgi:hypothetical protein